MKTKRNILVLLAASGLLLAGCATEHHATQWEYKVSPPTVSGAAPATNQEKWKAQQDWLNELGSDGWILIFRDDSGVFYLRRPRR